MKPPRLKENARSQRSTLIRGRSPGRACSPGCCSSLSPPHPCPGSPRGHGCPGCLLAGCSPPNPLYGRSFRLHSAGEDASAPSVQEGPQVHSKVLGPGLTHKPNMRVRGPEGASLLRGARGDGQHEEGGWGRHTSAAHSLMLPQGGPARARPPLHPQPGGSDPCCPSLRPFPSGHVGSRWQSCRGNKGHL